MNNVPTLLVQAPVPWYLLFPLPEVLSPLHTLPTWRIPIHSSKHFIDETPPEFFLTTGMVELTIPLCTTYILLCGHRCQWSLFLHLPPLRDSEPCNGGDQFPAWVSVPPVMPDPR